MAKQVSIKSGVFSSRQWAQALLLLGGLLLLSFTLALLLGSAVSPLKVLTPWRLSEVEAKVLFEYRLGRALAAAGVGGCLGTAGAVLQAVLGNPLVEPYLLGMASGGALFVAAGMLLGLTWTLPLAALAFPGAVLAGGLVLGLAGMMGFRRPVGVILIGLMVNALLGALVQLAYAFASVHQAGAIVRWLLGALPEHASTGAGAGTLCLAVAGAAVLTVRSRALNLMLLGEEAARAAGVEAGRVRWLVFVVAALLTAVAVAVAGPIGFVGLVVPHLVRMCGGVDNRLVVPASALLGGAFVLLADTGARFIRFLGSTTAVPVGVLTALIGCPIFLWLLWREARRDE